MRDAVTKDKYIEILKNAPAHDSPEFLDYLRENNKKIYENNHWLVIENCKYHTKDKVWLTAFAKTKKRLYLAPLIHRFGHLTWLKKKPEKQTVPDRFHLHLYEE